MRFKYWKDESEYNNNNNKFYFKIMRYIYKIDYHSHYVISYSMY